MSIADNRSVLDEQVRNELNRQYDYYKQMLYALTYNARFVAIVNISVETTNPELKESCIRLSDEELISIISKRRELVHVQLNRINEFSTSGTREG